MNPDTQFIGALQRLMVAEFPPPSLERLTRFALGERLDVLVDPNGDTPTVVFRLITVAERREWIEELVRGVYEARPDRPAVRAFCNQYAQYVFTPRTTTGELVGEVGKRLGEVATSLDDPARAVQVVLTSEAKEHLTHLSTQFARLGHYKFLHDCLHTLQFKYARAVSYAMKTLFQSQEVDEQADAKTDLAIYCGQMNDALVRVRPCAKALRSADDAKWLDDAAEAIGQIRDGSAQRNQVTATDGYALLESLLRTQPTRVNQGLTGVLERLQFDALLRAFTTLREQFPADNQLADGLDVARRALGNLVPRLNRELSDHKDWQLIDNTLVQIDTEFRIKSPASVRKVLWTRASPILQPLLDEGREAAWATELRQLQNDFTTSLNASDQEGHSMFRQFRARVGSYFYEVDLRLKELSANLATVGTQLDLILKVIR